MWSSSREKIYKGLRPRPITYMYVFAKGLGLTPYAVQELTAVNFEMKINFA